MLSDSLPAQAICVQSRRNSGPEIGFSSSEILNGPRAQLFRDYMLHNIATEGRNIFYTFLSSISAFTLLRLAVPWTPQ